MTCGHHHAARRRSLLLVSDLDPAASRGPSPRVAGGVHAPFHGLVTVLVKVGERVEAGQVVAVLEAMKMEAPITAPRPGTVRLVAVEVTATVAGGDLLLALD